ncbi:unnamed protein product [Meganyctiphanes norvegica]|uniref:Uncharacterized protein n=1 Tax=Meganyctiphanes norvegica TaxID=48144 RepID=A0AAV2Q9D3_MEGNR
MTEIDYENGSLFQEMRDILSVDNDEKVVTLCHKLTQLPASDFYKLVNENVKLIFSNRQCGDLITITDDLVFPEKCSDPYLRLGLMCFKFIFICSADVMRQNIFITISQIVVDNYIPYVEGNLFNSHILIDLLNIMRETDAFSCRQARLQLTFGARELNKTHNDLLDEFYANTIDLFAKLILIEIKCINFKNTSDVMLVYNDMVKFFDIYYEISKYIGEKYHKNPPLIKKSVMSAISIITNCILLLYAKLLATDIDTTHWSSILCRMEKLRDHMATFRLLPSSGTSLQRFLIERAHGTFNTNCAKKLYNVTNDISHIRVTERSSAKTIQTSLRSMGVVLYHLKQHVNHNCYLFKIQHRVVKRLCPKQYVNGLFSSDESLSSGCENSSSETDGETDE